MRVLVASLLVVAACAGSQKHTENLLDQSTQYQEGLRWGRYEDAAAHVPPAEREAFLDEHDALAEELRIDDYEVIRVHVKKDHDEAMVQVKYTWHLDSKGIVNETVTDQLWERKGANWWMKEELYKRGEDMPGVAQKSQKSMKSKRGAKARPKKSNESARPGGSQDDGDGDGDDGPDAVPRGEAGGEAGSEAGGGPSADPASEAAQSGKASGGAPL
jgi:hypothetical protein